MAIDEGIEENYGSDCIFLLSLEKMETISYPLSISVRNFSIFLFFFFLNLSIMSFHPPKF